MKTRSGNILKAEIIDFKTMEGRDQPTTNNDLDWTELALQVQLYARAADQVLGQNAKTGSVHLLKGQPTHRSSDHPGRGECCTSQCRMGSDWHSRVRLPDAATSSKMHELRFSFDLPQDTSEFQRVAYGLHRSFICQAGRKWLDRSANTRSRDDVPDNLTPEQRSYCMSRIKGKDTGLETPRALGTP